MRQQLRKFSVLVFAEGDPVTPDNDKKDKSDVVTKVAKARADKVAKDKAKKP